MIKTSDLQKLECQICWNKFNTTKLKPVIVCTNCHVVCLHCSEKIKEQFEGSRIKCPFCRSKFAKQSIVDFVGILKIKDEFGTLSQKNKILEEQVKRFLDMCLNLMDQISQLNLLTQFHLKSCFKAVEQFKQNDIKSQLKILGSMLDKQTSSTKKIIKQQVNIISKINQKGIKFFQQNPEEVKLIKNRRSDKGLKRTQEENCIQKNQMLAMNSKKKIINSQAQTQRVQKHEISFNRNTIFF